MGDDVEGREVDEKYSKSKFLSKTALALELYSPIAENSFFGTRIKDGIYWGQPHEVFRVNEVIKSGSNIEVGPSDDPLLIPSNRYSYISVNLVGYYSSDMRYDLHTGCITPIYTLSWSIGDLICAYLLERLIISIPYLNYDKAYPFVNISNQAHNRYKMCNHDMHHEAMLFVTELTTRIG